MLKILELKWVCAEADWKAMGCSLSIICRAHVKQSHTQLLPQQTLLLILLQDVLQLNASAASQAGWGQARGTATPGEVSTLPASRHCVSAGLDLSVPKHTCT